MQKRAKKGKNRTANRGGVRCKIYIFCSVFVHDPFGFCSVSCGFFIRFFFVGVVCYNGIIQARLWKTPQNLQKYLKKRQNWRKKKAKIETYKKHSKFLKSDVFKNIKTKKSKKRAPILQAQPKLATRQTPMYIYISPSVSKGVIGVYYTKRHQATLIRYIQTIHRCYTR